MPDVGVRDNLAEAMAADQLIASKHDHWAAVS